jgi:hypothetical protein
MFFMYLLMWYSMEGSGLGLSPASTRIVRWACSVLAVCGVLTIFITRNFVKVSPTQLVILLAIPWVIFVIVLVYLIIREQGQEPIVPP